eukprot:g5253.t1
MFSGEDSADESKCSEEEFRELFSQNPETAVFYLIDHNIATSTNDCRPICRYILSISKIFQLDRVLLGRLLTESKLIPSRKLLEAFVIEIGFSRDANFLASLRKVLSYVKLRENRQVIEKFSRGFAAAFTQKNPSAFHNEECAFVLTFSTIMLDVFLYGEESSPARILSKPQFFKTVTNVPAGKVVRHKLISQVYDSIVKRRLGCFAPQHIINLSLRLAESELEKRNKENRERQRKEKTKSTERDSKIDTTQESIYRNKIEVNNEYENRIEPFIAQKILLQHLKEINAIHSPKVINAFQKIDRLHFLPGHSPYVAYGDRRVLIEKEHIQKVCNKYSKENKNKMKGKEGVEGKGEEKGIEGGGENEEIILLAPREYCAILEAIDLSPGDKVLIIGSGTGYLAALVSELVTSKGICRCIDSNREMVEYAKHCQSEHHMQIAMNAMLLATSSDTSVQEKQYHNANERSPAITTFAHANLFHFGSNVTHVYNRIIIAGCVPWGKKNEVINLLSKRRGSIMVAAFEDHAEGSGVDYHCNFWKVTRTKPYGENLSHDYRATEILISESKNYPKSLSPTPASGPCRLGYIPILQEPICIGSELEDDPYLSLPRSTAENESDERAIASRWSVEEVAVWLEALGLWEYASSFENEGIDGSLLMQLDSVMMEELGVTEMEHRAKIIMAINELWNYTIEKGFGNDTSSGIDFKTESESESEEEEDKENEIQSEMNMKFAKENENNSFHLNIDVETPSNKLYFDETGTPRERETSSNELYFDETGTPRERETSSNELYFDETGTPRERETSSSSSSPKVLQSEKDIGVLKFSENINKDERKYEYDEIDLNESNDSINANVDEEEYLSDSDKDNDDSLFYTYESYTADENEVTDNENENYTYESYTVDESETDENTDESIIESIVENDSKNIIENDSKNIIENENEEDAKSQSYDFRSLETSQASISDSLGLGNVDDHSVHQEFPEKTLHEQVLKESNKVELVESKTAKRPWGDSPAFGRLEKAKKRFEIAKNQKESKENEKKIQSKIQMIEKISKTNNDVEIDEKDVSIVEVEHSNPLFESKSFTKYSKQFSPKRLTKEKKKTLRKKVMSSLKKRFRRRRKKKR